MKKVLSSILTFVILFSFASCSEATRYCTQQHYDYASKSTQIIDDYLDEKITLSEAYDLMDDLIESEGKKLPDTSDDMLSGIADTNIEDTVHSFLSLLSGHTTDVGIKQARDEFYNEYTKYDTLESTKESGEDTYLCTQDCYDYAQLALQIAEKYLNEGLSGENAYIEARELYASNDEISDDYDNISLKIAANDVIYSFDEDERRTVKETVKNNMEALSNILSVCTVANSGNTEAEG